MLCVCTKTEGFLSCVKKFKAKNRKGKAERKNQKGKIRKEKSEKKKLKGKPRKSKFKLKVKVMGVSKV